jgi:hypothetical protein
MEKPARPAPPVRLSSVEDDREADRGAKTGTEARQRPGGKEHGETAAHRGGQAAHADTGSAREQ